MNLKLSDLLNQPSLLEIGFGESIIIDKDFNLVYPTDEEGKLFDLRPHFYPQRVKFEEVLASTNPKAWDDLESNSPQGKIYYHLKLTPLFNDDTTEVSGLLIQSDDRTKLKRSLNEMEERLKDMEKTTTAKSQFLANMSHELRSPMTSVIGMSHLLLETELDAEQRECAEVIHSSSTGLLNLINDTLDFSKLDAGKVQLESIPFNLYGLTSQVCKGFKVQCDQAGTNIILDYHPDCHQQFRGDPGKLRQILNNFTSNAVKFTKVGDIKIEVTSEHADDKNETLKIVVHDSGIGMSPEVQSRIFKKFVQADDSTTRKYGGTGLGLAISKELVELMKGEIGVDSVQGQGSSFWMKISLPYESEASNLLKRVDVLSKKILVVDSNPSILNIQARNLISSGMQCETSENAQAAINKLIHAAEDKAPFDALISDFELPGMDGAQMGNLIKNDPKISQTHLIMLTSMGRKGDSKLMLDAGYDAYLVKPAAHDVLLDVISCVLARSGPSGELITKYTLSEEKPNQDHQREAPKRSAPESPQTSSSEQIEVLIAEDDPMIQKMLKKLMKKLNQPFCLVDNGQDAFEKAKSGNYPLILMDWHMPKMDGLQATGQIREFEGETRKTWIVALTAGGADDVKTKCLKAGMDDHLPKPFEVENFKKMMAQGLEMARQLKVSS